MTPHNPARFSPLTVLGFFLDRVKSAFNYYLRFSLEVVR